MRNIGILAGEARGKEGRLSRDSMAALGQLGLTWEGGESRDQWVEITGQLLWGYSGGTFWEMGLSVGDCQA